MGRARHPWRLPSVKRAVSLFVAGLIMFFAAGVLLGPASDRQDRLVENGVAVEGTVLRAVDPIRGPRTVDFGYSFRGQEYVSEIFGSDHYDTGDVVTVYVDPAEPESATLDGEQPQSRPAYFLTLVIVTASFLAMGWGASDLWKSWRRRRAQ